MIRFSRETDKEHIAELIEECFGKFEGAGVLNNLNGKYLLYFDKWRRLIAMTGLDFNSDCVSGVEIALTCTHPYYRGTGIQHELFKKLTELTDDDIYCRCLVQSYEKKSLLQTVLLDSGFVCVCEGIDKNCYPHKCKIGTSCKNWGGEGCTCRCDLYVRKVNDNV